MVSKILWKFKVFCKYKDNGCFEELTHDEYYVHIKKCKFKDKEKREKEFDSDREIDPVKIEVIRKL